MRILWVNPSFSDYRVPVYAELDRLTGGEFRIVYSKTRTHARVDAKIREVLGPRAIGLDGERSLGLRQEDAHFANTGVRIPYQPDLLNQVLGTQADVVIAEGFFQWTPAALAKRQFQRVPLVISYERTAHTERNCPRWRTLYRRAVVRMTDAMTCNGVLSMEYSKTLGMPARRITTGQMVVDVESFAKTVTGISARDRLSIRDELGVQGACFLYVGSISQRKGTQALLDAWRRFRGAVAAPATLLLAGDGPERSTIQRGGSQGEDDNVRFLGTVGYDRLPSVYVAADVFVMPTLEDNWSLVVPEAMACGLPILCSIYNGCWPELIQPDRNGWVFDPLKPNELPALLTKCISDRSALVAMGASSRRIVNEFTPTTAARSILQACEIARTRRRRATS
jgi:glycosyltransferase involved in cell wall biosynthesis